MRFIELIDRMEISMLSILNIDVMWSEYNAMHFDVMTNQYNESEWIHMVNFACIDEKRFSNWYDISIKLMYFAFRRIFFLLSRDEW